MSRQGVAYVLRILSCSLGVRSIWILSPSERSGCAGGSLLIVKKEDVIRTWRQSSLGNLSAWETRTIPEIERVV